MKTIFEGKNIVKAILLSGLMLLTFNYSVAQDKNPESNFTEYKNELIMPNSKGQLLLLSKEDNKTFTLIKWSKGFYSIGTLIDNKENGHWYLFSKKGIIRKDVFFSNGEPNQVTNYDKKGKQVYKSNFSTNF